MRTAVYLRISMDRTGEGLGVDRQRQDCRALVEQRGGTVADEFVDNDVSASKGRRRPAYEAMLAEIQAGRIEAIAAWALDRLVRRMADLERLADLCKRHHVTILLVRGSDLDLSTPSGVLVAGLLGQVAKYEVDAKGDRQRRAARQRAERGVPGGGRRAFGYDASGAQIIDSEAVHLRAMYTAILSGRTLTGIALDLNAKGVKTTMGGTWKHNSVRVALTNPRNAALRAYQGEIIGKATWPPIVSEEVFRAAVEVLTRPSRRTNKAGNARRWLGTGLYVCGECDPAVTMISTYREKYDDGRVRRVYRCPTCKLSRLAEPVDEFVIQVVAERLNRPDALDLLAVETPTVDTARLRAEAMALRERRRGALGLFAAGDLNSRELKTLRDEIDERLAAVETQLASAGRGNVLAQVIDSPRPGDTWRDLPELDRRQAIVRALCTVRLLRSAPGVRIFDPTTVVIEPVDDLTQ